MAVLSKTRGVAPTYGTESGAKSTSRSAAASVARASASSWPGTCRSLHECVYHLALRIWGTTFGFLQHSEARCCHILRVDSRVSGYGGVDTVREIRGVQQVRCTERRCNICGRMRLFYQGEPRRGWVKEMYTRLRWRPRGRPRFR